MTSSGVAPRPVGASRPRIELSAVSKSFAGVEVLSGVSLAVAPGEVLGLCGANGAGKSTLIKILAGIHHADGGVVRLDGEEVAIGSARAADALGLRFMHQELNLVDHFDAAANMSLGYSRRSVRGMLARRHYRERAREVLAQVGADIPLDTPVGSMSVSDRWMVALGRTLMDDARVIALDEPTASFTDEEATRVFAVVDELRRRGVAVLYVSHRLEEVLAVCDRVAVLRDGRLTGTFAAVDIDRGRLTDEIAGRAMAPARRPVAERADLTERPVVLQVANLASGPRVHDVSLTVRRGEIFGIAGLVGSGRTELARAISGIDRLSAGRMTLHGRDYRPKTPYDAIGQGISFVPEERRSEALVMGLSIAANMAMSTLKDDRRWSWLPFVSPRRSRAVATTMAQRLNVRAASVRQPVSQLSGGNQQKVVVGRCLRASPALLVLDEPTVGVDVAAREDLYRAVRDLAGAGTAVLMISSDFEELEMCDTVAILRAGRTVGVVNGDDATKEHLTALCFEEVPA
ncbi:sugar ABC transporter ATP-binding protein [Amycolatopsis panacis]|uniref:Sugar ABC transporter ATP-binding protein n=1 Tax=Amycolatopsis panacis TaxID=2340917 RepID=A0A419I2L2_9PSEU|nr:sugar ABC transporter ATP-binding protein [Amycolatopsis panacis]RJQ84202.1 sugar ABC transporter ATP-binding protein [Amycolatopsis panacis]